jgi:hypothetical protein
MDCAICYLWENVYLVMMPEYLPANAVLAGHPAMGPAGGPEF